MTKRAPLPLGEIRPLTPTEIRQFSIALRELAFAGTPLPKHLQRIDATHSWGTTLDALPAALALLGEERDAVVVGLLRQFDRAVTDNLTRVKTRDRSKPFEFDPGISARYSSTSIVTGRDRPARPTTEKGICEVVSFLQSPHAEVREQAAWMLAGTTYSESTFDALLAAVRRHGIKRWPNPFARALASFATIAKVNQQLLQLLSSSDENLRHLAVLAFSEMGPRAGEAAIDALERIASSPDDNRQGAAISALREIVPRSVRLRKIALEQIASPHYWVRNTCIWALRGLADPETVSALIRSLLDRGGPDNENDLDSAKFLHEIPLDPAQVLTPLIEQFRQLMHREQETYTSQHHYREQIQALANAFKEAANARGNYDPDLGIVRLGTPEILLALARLFEKLGPDAHPALPVLAECLSLECVRVTTSVKDFQQIIAAISGPSE